MAEISYPFESSNADGGTALVSQTQWQSMAGTWANDCIDFSLTGASQSLPFNASVSGSRDVVVQPGKAWVGGFYYQLTAALTLTTALNPGSLPRRDLVVVRVDMTKSAANLVILQGTPAASPVPPALTRNAGAVWEMPLHEIIVPELNGVVTLANRRMFKRPGGFVSNWNTPETLSRAVPGTFAIDMDTNGSGADQREYFKGNEGEHATRHMNRSTVYTPNMVNMSSGAMERYGRWRYIAPNTVWFSARVFNPLSLQYTKEDGTPAWGLTLPVPANAHADQGFSGFLNNDELVGANLPNFAHVFARIIPNSSSMHFYTQNTTSLANGLDGMSVLPGRAYVTVSGVYEAAQFTE